MTIPLRAELARRLPLPQQQRYSGEGNHAWRAATVLTERSGFLANESIG